MKRREINVTFSVTDDEYTLLAMGKCEAPNPARMKAMLLGEARRNVMNFIKDVTENRRLHEPSDALRLTRSADVRVVGE